MKRIIIFLMLLFSIPLFSQINIHEYFPLTIGAKWDYLHKGNCEIIHFGGEIESTPKKATIEIKCISSDTTLFHYNLQICPKIWDNIIDVVFISKQDSILCCAYSNGLFGIDYWRKPILFLLSNMVLNKIYSSSNEYYSSYNMVLVARHEKLMVLDIEYSDVLEIKTFDNFNQIYYRFYAKNIGLIREDSEEKGLRTTILQLKNYSHK